MTYKIIKTDMSMVPCYV